MTEWVEKMEEAVWRRAEIHRKRMEIFEQWSKKEDVFENKNKKNNNKIPKNRKGLDERFWANTKPNGSVSMKKSSSQGINRCVTKNLTSFKKQSKF